MPKFEVRYICTGSCHGVATEEQHSQGATVCQAEDCEKRGQPLQKRYQCPKCDEYFEKEEDHKCPE